ncbi:hypothetical protein vBAspALolek_30 [Aeromonas phage vB_AspA_Lolek]|nr:hypothetical protein vBAspALolek_30 [Aeromonas phage vB_AspA_Lolek]
MLKVTIPIAKLSELGHVGYDEYIVGALRDAGIPISPVAGRLQNGTLSVYKEVQTLNTIYLWKE